jgi:hypothetical protein
MMVDDWLEAAYEDRTHIQDDGDYGDYGDVMCDFCGAFYIADDDTDEGACPDCEGSDE